MGNELAIKTQTHYRGKTAIGGPLTMGKCLMSLSKSHEAVVFNLLTPPVAEELILEATGCISNLKSTD